jgi:hypothetical protein
MTQYLRFTEHNDWEGETWHFYIPFDDQHLEWIKAKLSSDEVFDYSYVLSEKKIYTEAEVDILVQNSDCGYMMEHNKVKEISIDENKEDPFYKGSCFICEDL